MGVFTVSRKLLNTARKIVPLPAINYRSTNVKIASDFPTPENKNHYVLSTNRAMEGSSRTMSPCFIE